VQGGLTLAGVALLAGCGLPSHAWQPAPKIPRIGFLGTTTAPAETRCSAMACAGWAMSRAALSWSRSAGRSRTS